ncbi:hypothetical protein B0O99DRAFT_511189 [Bisporella sp. PMI_857]|nr:hypothetical protein B0O99DRAFT_511189 [Bisporella sp. PMI_857]
MEAAGFKIMLERLKEEWQEVADPSVYRELELEKQLWMLCAVRSLNKQMKTGRTSMPFLENPLGSTKVLSLYENHASASLLSALLEGPEVHHFSPNPVSPRSFPNIHPLAVPSPTATLPYASSIFSSIRALSLSVQLPASSLPAALKECHRIMISGGSLHLTILDPSPITSSLGPCLRTWLDNHLLLNLERQFRCINPSRLFPIWLADAGLRGEGSTIATARFLACPSVSLCGSHSSADNLQMKGNLRDGSVDGKQISHTKHELQTQVGRMLWRELWGSFAQGERWWWDDEAIVEECERMGTAWEYSIIEAIKR